MRKLLTALIFSSMLYGCGVVQKAILPTRTITTPEGIVEAVTPIETLTVLSAIGGLCLLAGMGLLVFSRGTMGWRPIIGGVAFIVLNYAIAEYADWIFIPALIATGCISSAWAWKTIESIFKKEYKK